MESYIIKRISSASKRLKEAFNTYFGIYPNKKWEFKSTYNQKVKNTNSRIRECLYRFSENFNYAKYEDLKKNIPFVKDYILDFKAVSNNYLSLVNDSEIKKIIMDLSDEITKAKKEYLENNKEFNLEDFLEHNNNFGLIASIINPPSNNFEELMLNVITDIKNGKKNEYPISSHLLESAGFWIGERAGIYDKYEQKISRKVFYEAFEDFEKIYKDYMKDCSKKINILLNSKDIKIADSKLGIIKNLDELTKSMELEYDLLRINQKYPNNLTINMINNIIKNELNKWIKKQEKSPDDELKELIKKDFKNKYSEKFFYKIKNTLKEVDNFSEFDKICQMKNKIKILQKK